MAQRYVDKDGNPDPTGICKSADWMLLSAPQDTIVEPDRPFLGMPAMFDNWSRIGTSMTDLKDQFARLPFYGTVVSDWDVDQADSGDLPTPNWGTRSSLRELTPSSMTDVLLSVNSNIINDWQRGLAGVPDEVCGLGWTMSCVLTKPITQSQNPDNVHLDLWSWGSADHPIDAPSAVVAEYYEGALVANDNRPNWAGP